MQPGLPRAVPMGIAGFALGALIAIVIRMIQGIGPASPEYNGFIGPAMVLGAFISSGFFVWGMGAFDPRMSVHGEHVPVEAEEAKAESPASILSGFTWQITFWTIVIVLAIAVFVFVPFGPNIRSVNPNEGNVAAIGYVAVGDIYKAVREFVQSATAIVLPQISDDLAAIQLSYLVLFLLFCAWTIFSLFVVAGLTAMLVNYLTVGRKNADAVSVPWRAIIFVVLIASLLPLPLIVASKVVPLAVLMPAYILPQLLLFIVFRRPIWLILLILALPLPMLVPNVSLSEISNVMFVLIGAALLIGAFSLIRHALPERVGKAVAYGGYALITIGVIVFTVASTRTDIWQMWFLLFIVIVELGLVLPVPFLKALISSSIWDRFGAVDWVMVVPRFAGWLAHLLRDGLPKFLGQR
jgi:hypothetical protein